MDLVRGNVWTKARGRARYLVAGVLTDLRGGLSAGDGRVGVTKLVAPCSIPNIQGQCLRSRDGRRSTLALVQIRRGIVCASRTLRNTGDHRTQGMSITFTATRGQVLALIHALIGMIREGRNAIRTGGDVLRVQLVRRVENSFVVIGYDSAVMTCGI